MTSINKEGEVLYDEIPIDKPSYQRSVVFCFHIIEGKSYLYQWWNDRSNGVWVKVETR